MRQRSEHPVAHQSVGVAHAVGASPQIRRIRVGEEHRSGTEPRVESRYDLAAIGGPIAHVDDDRRRVAEFVEQFLAFDPLEMNVTFLDLLGQLVGDSPEPDQRHDLLRVALIRRRIGRHVQTIGVSVSIVVEARTALAPEQPLRDHLALQLDRRKALCLGSRIDRFRRGKVDVEADEVH